MQVVNADVAGEPHQGLRQIVEGASVQGGLGMRPVGLMLPMGVLELVLHIKQPDADGGADEDNRQLNGEERADANGVDQQCRDRHQAKIGQERASPGHGASAHRAERQPVSQDEEIGRSQSEHDDRMPVKPITQSATPAEP